MFSSIRFDVLKAIHLSASQRGMSPRRPSQARRTFVDTSAYFALLDADDANHTQARTISHRLIAEGWRLFTTSFVLAETHALLVNRLSQPLATRFLRDMEHSPTTLVWVTPTDMQRAKAIIYQYTDKAFSLTNATSFAVMERLRIPAVFTFDRDFAQYGFSVLQAHS
jgi:predicted nucleic acid-binding protein